MAQDKPDSGLDPLVCAEFARQRSEDSQNGHEYTPTSCVGPTPCITPPALNVDQIVSFEPSGVYHRSPDSDGISYKPRELKKGDLIKAPVPVRPLSCPLG